MVPNHRTRPNFWGNWQSWDGHGTGFAARPSCTTLPKAVALLSALVWLKHSLQNPKMHPSSCGNCAAMLCVAHVMWVKHGFRSLVWPGYTTYNSISLIYFSLWENNGKHGFVWKCCVPHCTQWFCWSLSRFEKWLAIIGNINPTFSGPNPYGFRRFLSSWKTHIITNGGLATLLIATFLTGVGSILTHILAPPDARN